MNGLETLRIILGTLFVLFAPGFVWSYVFFARKTIDWIERVAISFGLSIALVPISLFWLNWLFHMKLTLLNASLTVGGLAVLAIISLIIKKSLTGKSAASRLKSSGYFHKDEQNDG